LTPAARIRLHATGFDLPFSCFDFDAVGDIWLWG
jgi:hypothetical protein